MGNQYFISILFLCISTFTFGQNQVSIEHNKANKFRYLALKTHFGAFLKSENTIGQSGLLDHGYGGVTIKAGWQPTDSEKWSSRYNYPSYGIGFYTGFLSDAQVFGNPNAIYGFIRFPLSKPGSKNVFAIEPSLGLTYKLNPYNSETNPINDAIGARMAVYFNLDFGFTYKWTREVDFLYGIDFTHFSNGSTYKPNSGLNLYGIHVGLRYNYNQTQKEVNNDIYSNDVLAARFKRPFRSPIHRVCERTISVYIAGGVAQSDELMGTDVLMGVFSGVVDYEYKFNEMHGISAGADIFYDNRFRDRNAVDRIMPAIHAGYAFSFYKLDVKIQVGTYIGGQKGKGNFFMRPALRYHVNKHIFTQIGLKTLDGGKADYIEYGIGFKPFSW